MGEHSSCPPMWSLLSYFSPVHCVQLTTQQASQCSYWGSIFKNHTFKKLHKIWNPNALNVFALCLTKSLSAFLGVYLVLKNKRFYTQGHIDWLLQVSWEIIEFSSEPQKSVTVYILTTTWLFYLLKTYICFMFFDLYH